jgi:hypothetical protein
VVPLERMGLHAEESANVNQTKGHRHSTITRCQRCLRRKGDRRMSYIYIIENKIVLNIRVKKKVYIKKKNDISIFDEILSCCN